MDSSRLQGRALSDLSLAPMVIRIANIRKGNDHSHFLLLGMRRRYLEGSICKLFLIAWIPDLIEAYRKPIRIKPLGDRIHERRLCRRTNPFPEPPKISPAPGAGSPLLLCQQETKTPKGRDPSTSSWKLMIEFNSAHHKPLRRNVLILHISSVTKRCQRLYCELLSPVISVTRA